MYHIHKYHSELNLQRGRLLYTSKLYYLCRIILRTVSLKIRPDLWVLFVFFENLFVVLP